ncbi:hypothetical protein [Raoultibacter phocaeensis]|uniref:hypothetical protein n=1 Tax=Raoultibacter phocaeensis TaxID=2479841 RepID=UPI0015D64BD2|nr:hypothetical protein [Raoultibacter phocaeensis]
MEAMVTALTTGITGIATECLSALGTIVPAALPIAGGIIVITLGIGVFKRMAR